MWWCVSIWVTVSSTHKHCCLLGSAQRKINSFLVSASNQLEPEAWISKISIWCKQQTSLLLKPLKNTYTWATSSIFYLHYTLFCYKIPCINLRSSIIDLKSFPSAICRVVCCVPHFPWTSSLRWLETYSANWWQQAVHPAPVVLLQLFFLNSAAHSNLKIPDG